MNKQLIFVFSLCVMLLLISCTTISEEEAKKNAMSFVKTNVKFYSENKTVLNAYYQVVNSKKTNEGYLFDIIATTTSEEKIKSGKFVIAVNKQGIVESVNNKPVPNQ